MNPLYELATQALLGSERRPLALAALAGAVGELLEAATPADTALETRVLRRAGVLPICADAGYQPAPAQEAPFPVCVAEARAAVTDPRWQTVLGEIFQDGPGLLQQEALRQLAGYGACLPPGVLPAALTAAGKTPALQAALLPVLGERGRWLARFNPDWGYALGGGDTRPDPALWEHGALDVRKAFLNHLRQWLRLLRKSARHTGLSELLNRITQTGAPCSADFFREMLRHIRATVASDAGKWDYPLRHTLPEFICLVPVPVLEETLRNWPVEPEAQYLSETLARLFAIAERRKILHRPPTVWNSL